MFRISSSPDLKKLGIALLISVSSGISTASPRPVWEHEGGAIADSSCRLDNKRRGSGGAWNIGIRENDVSDINLR